MYQALARQAGSPLVETIRAVAAAELNWPAGGGPRADPAATNAAFNALAG